MTRIFFGCLLALLLSTTLAAQNVSTQQMQLVTSSVFTTRLQFLGWQVAGEVLVEPATAAVNGVIPAYTAICHARRASFARSFIGSPASGAIAIAVGLSGANVSGAVILGTVVVVNGSADSSATDGAISQAIRVLYNNFAGCVTTEG